MIFVPPKLKNSPRATEVIALNNISIINNLAILLFVYKTLII